MNLKNAFIWAPARKQRGGAVVILVSVLAVIALIIAMGIMYVISSNNTANGFEQQLKAQKSANENALAQYGQKIQEAVQVPGMMRDDLVKVAKEAMQGRYGENGSQAVFQMLREHNPTLDPGVYTKLQQLIESGRDEFKLRQDRLLDIKRSYETALGNWPQGVVMRMLGYPRLNLAEFDIVSTGRAQEAFRTGVEAPIQLRPEAK